MAISGDVSGLGFAQGNDADDGTYTTALVAAVAGKKIRVMGLTITVLTTAGVVSILSGSTVILAQHLALGTPLVLGYSGVPVCETATGEALTASNASGVDSYISVSYATVEP